MARPREFDEDAVLRAAAHRFWMYGYEATSVRDLGREMGITQASLYNAFGDKRSLFQLALGYYVENNFAERSSRIERELSGRKAIETFLKEIIELSLKDPDRKGCLLVNSAMEVAPHDPALQSVIAAELARVEAFFKRCIVAGQQAGDIPALLAPDDLAKMLLSVHIGIRVLARSRPERALLEGAARPAFALLRGDGKERKRAVRRSN
ncbi:TetR/AcrR family transcriptional regulator [Paraburkholderia sp. DHOC27]|uniref:TetR/AcrR family transcriptional regulator n=1 Tax=Paraburkholderia sp. DHOC27 TaxID=2303330 RepID=UPI000E3D185C|nr:TetR/AcrR family transcriptional regulator [Paraburkholderia sp. DHOC27]RFU49157.1 TetR/AcrR family transcriptional regulator [Paraburkholderia sp. DHOC27]